MRLQQSRKDVTLTFDLPPGINAADISVVAEADAVRIVMGRGLPFMFPLPAGCTIRPEGTRFEVDELSVPRHLTIVVEKAVEVWWPFDEPSPRGSTASVVGPPAPAAPAPVPPPRAHAEPAAATGEQVSADAPASPKLDLFDVALGWHRRASAVFWRAFAWSPWFGEHWFGVVICAIYAAALLSYLNDVWLDDKRTWSVALFAFQKGLGLVFVGAWMSAGSQIIGLIGERGIVPLPDTVAAMDAVGASVPTLFRWAGWAPTNRNLRLHVLLGLAFASLFTLNVAPSLTMLACVLVYMSMRVCGSVFFQLQFDSLLLETGWLAVVCYSSPVHWVHFSFYGAGMVSKTGLFLCWWLLFRLLFSSGVVKLTSRDKTWANCTAMQYHYWTQPLPNWIGYYWHHWLSPRMHQASCYAMFAFELVGPWCFFLGPWLRVPLGFTTAMGLQALIMLTGNYGFFNVLTIVLSLTLVDDSYWPAFVVRSVQASDAAPLATGWLLSVVGIVWTPLCTVVATVCAAVILFASLEPLLSLSRSQLRLLPVLETLYSGKLQLAPWRALVPAPVLALLVRPDKDHVTLHTLYRLLAHWSVLSSYGLFAVMTTTRDEVLIYGSDDQVNWKSYDLYHKPGDNLTRAPTFVPLCHLPRLDWRLWFVPFGRANPWVDTLCHRLLSGEPSVLELFRVVPFADRPPKYLKVELWQYQFASLAHLRQTGCYWRRSYKAPLSKGVIVLEAPGAKTV